MKSIVDLPDLNRALAQLGTPNSLLALGGRMLFSCGIPSNDAVARTIVSGNIEAQTHAVLLIMQASLEGAGSSLEISSKLRYLS